VVVDVSVRISVFCFLAVVDSVAIVVVVFSVFDAIVVVIVWIVI
jgi:hypothetical protein